MRRASTRALSVTLVFSLATADAAEWAWRPMLAAPRIGGRLWSLAVDPANPERIFIGTEEGTIVRSIDGGSSWSERELGPVVTEQARVGFAGPELPDLGDHTVPLFFVYPPDTDYADLPRYLSFPILSFFVQPDFFYLNAKPLLTDPEASVLYDLTSEPTRAPTPVVRIELCEEARFPILAATSSELFGSDDDGLTFVRLFAVTADETIADVVCSPIDPEVIALATSSGMFVSSNGGATFGPTSGLWPGDPASAVEFSPDGRLLAADAETLYEGLPGSELSEIYPASQDSDTTPWLDIRSIEVSLEAPSDESSSLEGATGSPCPGRVRPRGKRKRAQLTPESTQSPNSPSAEVTPVPPLVAPTRPHTIWLATDGGLRFRGPNKKWSRAPGLEGELTTQVRVGWSPTGRLRIATMTRDHVFASDDEGRTWSPFFHGLTPRTFRWVASTPASASGPPAWYVLTSGELWTTAPLPPRSSRGADPLPLQKWATGQLEGSESLESLIDRVLGRVGLTEDAIDDLYGRAEGKNWMPYIDVRLDFTRDTFVGRDESVGAVVRTTTLETHDNDAALLVQFSWWWDPPADSTGRNELHELRKRVGYAAADAWRERRSVLTELATGRGTPFELESMRLRAEALGSLLDIWAGGSPHAGETR